MDRKLIITGLTFISIGILLGAFASHGLKTNGVFPEKIESFQTGVRYLFYQGFGLLILVPLQAKFNFTFKTQYRQIMWGTILFSLSIFLLVLFPLIGLNINKYFAPVTPVGGILIFLGWFSILMKYLRN